MKIQVQIRCRWTNRPVDAMLDDQPTVKNILDVGQYRERHPRWKKSFLRPFAPIDLDWYWEARMKTAIANPFVSVWILECDDALKQGLPATQGMIAFQNRQSFSDPAINITYLNLIGVAPHNRRFGVGRFSIPGKYKGVKILLLNRATTMSQNNGMNGVIGLFAKPKTEGFYKRLGLKNKKIEDKNGNTYFEGTIR